jgi:hypothetical protein
LGPTSGGGSARMHRGGEQAVGMISCELHLQSVNCADNSGTTGSFPEMDI